VTSHRAATDHESRQAGPVPEDEAPAQQTVTPVGPFDEALAAIGTPHGDFWIFGYGSLMWNPGFPHIDRKHAVLRGFHRRFCIRSTIYRGTPEQPGLVLGVDAGGECNGMAFRVDAVKRNDVIAYLYAREMRNHVYAPTWVSVLIDGDEHEALTFVVKRDHRSYTTLPECETAQIIASCRGENGTNYEYLENTVHALHALGVPDSDLDLLHQRVKDLREFD
jgi:cation transport protein ChaC